MTVSRYTPETFSRPVQSREKRELDRGRRATALQRIQISLDSQSLPEIILTDDTSGNSYARVCVGWRGRWDLHMTNSTGFFLPSFLPCWHLWPKGHTPGIIIFISSRMSVCLSVCPSARTSVLPFRVCLFCLDVRLPSHRGNLFSDAFEDSPEASLFPPPHTRDGALSFLRATRDGKSSRPPLLLGRYPSCAMFYGILVEICKNGKEYL